MLRRSAASKLCGSLLVLLLEVLLLPVKGLAGAVSEHSAGASLLLLLLLLCCLVRSRLQLLPLHAATLSAVLYCSHYCCCVLMQGEMLYCVVH